MVDFLKKNDDAFLPLVVSLLRGFKRRRGTTS